MRLNSNNINLLLVCILIALLGYIFHLHWNYLNWRNRQALKEKSNYIMENSGKLNSAILLVALVVFMLMFTLKFAFGNLNFKIQSLNIGGINILLNSPDEIFVDKMKNYLSTKRTLFYIDSERDNFSDTLTSYYDTYKFIRDEIEIYPNDYSNKSKIYDHTKDIIVKLNMVLTKHQNNYRRWYDYEMENKSKDYYNIEKICIYYIRFKYLSLEKE